MTMKRIAIYFSVAAIMFTSGCEDILSILGSGALTDEEIVQGLKDALIHGSDTATTRLHKEDGYFGDQFVKILLPEEAQPVYNVISLLPTNIVDNTILAINRAAEDAATEAYPIFVGAITEMTIADGTDILFGEDTAATHYLRNKTYQDLFDAFKPRIENSLSKDLVLGISAEEMYSSLVSAYNTASLGGILFEQIKTNSLSEHTTNKALRGLFMKVGNEEKLIREDPAHRVTELMDKVFSELDN